MSSEIASRVAVPALPALETRLPGVGTTIFTVMSALAAEHGAINLSQGFPDFSGPTELLEGVANYLRSGANQYAPMAGVPALRMAVAEKVAALYGRQVDAEREVTITSGATEALFDAVAAVIRPGDANETSYAWRAAIEQTHGPTALILTRQGLPTYDRTKFGSAEGTLKGAYILADAEKIDVILIASGSEVSVAVAAREELAKQNIGARVVSMPSWELFDNQTQEYRDSVLPPSITARVAIEAAIMQGWEKYVGSNGVLIGMNGFGASAPIKVLMEKFGFTAANVVAKVKALLGK